MNTPSDELFNIIKALKSHEKRLFKQFSESHDSKSLYLELFDAIDGLEVYNEPELIKKLEKKTAIINFPKLKNYLLESLYGFLEYHFSSNSVETNLQRAIQRTEILNKMGLHSEAKKQLIKAEKTAVFNQKYIYHLVILDWKRKLLLQQLNISDFNDYEQLFFLKEIETINNYKNLIEYQRISVRLKRFSITQSENVDDKVIGELKNMLKMPMLKSESMAITLHAKLLYNYVLGDIYFLLGNMKKGALFLKRSVHYFDKVNIPLNEKLSILTRLLAVLSKLKQSDELIKVKDNISEMLRLTPLKNQPMEIKTTYLSIMNNYVFHQLCVHNIKEALIASDEILKPIAEFSNKQSYTVYFANRAEIFFFYNDFKNALTCINKVFAIEKETTRIDILSHLKLLVLLVHFELGNFDTIERLCKSLFRYFSKQQRSSKVENLLIDFFAELTKKRRNKSQIIKEFILLRNAIKPYKSERIFVYFDYISWIESKIQNKPMIEILKKKELGMGNK